LLCHIRTEIEPHRAAAMVFATLDMTMLAGLAFDTNGRFVGLCAPAARARRWQPGVFGVPAARTSPVACSPRAHAPPRPRRRSRASAGSACACARSQRGCCACARRRPVWSSPARIAVRGRALRAAHTGATGRGGSSTRVCVWRREGVDVGPRARGRGLTRVPLVWGVQRNRRLGLGYPHLPRRRAVRCHAPPHQGRRPGPPALRARRGRLLRPLRHWPVRRPELRPRLPGHCEFAMPFARCQRDAAV
jgi:hypothetical protein